MEDFKLSAIDWVQITLAVFLVVLAVKDQVVRDFAWFTIDIILGCLNLAIFLMFRYLDKWWNG